MRASSFAIRLLLLASLTSAQEEPSPTGYICVPDQSVGYKVDKSGKWRPAQFNVEGKKYLLRYRDGKWWWTDFGDEPKRQNSCGSFNPQGFLDCHNFEDDVRFNRISLRFQAIHPY